MKQRNHHHTGQDDPQTITKAVTHIRLEAINAGKLAALDALAYNGDTEKLSSTPTNNGERS